MMDSLFQEWRTKVPRYDEQFKEPIVKKLTNYGGGSEKNKVDKGRHFSNAYELYILAFFLGLHQRKRLKTEGRKADFSHHLQFWGNKGNSFDRKDFSDIQRYIFIALIARTEIDLIAVEKGEMEKKDAIAALLLALEEYTNSGLSLLANIYEEKGRDLNFDESFLNIYLDQLEINGLVGK